MACFNVIELIEVKFRSDLFSFEKVVDAVYIAVPESVNESLKRYRVADYLPQHQLYRPSLLDQALYATVMLLECTFIDCHLVFDPGSEVYTIDERLSMIVVLL